MNRGSIAIVRVGMTSSVGLSALQTAAAVRAGISGYRASCILDRNEERVTLAIVPEQDLPERSPALSGNGLSGRKMRMLRLASAALLECMAEERFPEQIPLLLAVPDVHPGLLFDIGREFLDRLVEQVGAPFDVKKSRVYSQGRAGGLWALNEAITRLRAGAADRILVGGVDSHVDLMLLAMLEAEQRLRADGNFDGFTPGEGAAFLLLMRYESALRERREVIACIDAAAIAEEPGHRYSDEPYRGEGLDRAFRQAFAGTTVVDAVQTVYAGLNGENFSSKEWGIAYLRHRSRFIENVRMEHPADTFGDTGAALGPMMLVLAALGLQRKYRASPCLVWSSSDKAERAAALLRKV